MEDLKKIQEFFSKPLDEATKEEETEFHKKLDTLVHNTFGKRKGEMEEVVNYSTEEINEAKRILVKRVMEKLHKL